MIGNQNIVLLYSFHLTGKKKLTSHYSCHNSISVKSLPRSIQTFTEHEKKWILITLLEKFNSLFDQRQTGGTCYVDIFATVSRLEQARYCFLLLVLSQSWRKDFKPEQGKFATVEFVVDMFGKSRKYVAALVDNCWKASEGIVLCTRPYLCEWFKHSFKTAINVIVKVRPKSLSVCRLWSTRFCTEVFSHDRGGKTVCQNW